MEDTYQVDRVGAHRIPITIEREIFNNQLFDLFAVVVSLRRLHEIISPSFSLFLSNACTGMVSSKRLWISGFHTYHPVWLSFASTGFRYSRVCFHAV